MEGWIKLHRSLLAWGWYSDANARALFIHCLLRANHKDSMWRGSSIKRGSFITSLDNLSNELGISKQSIRTAIKKLKSTHEITVISNSQYTEIHINNYDTYQADNTPSNTRATHEQHTSNTRLTPDKECKNVKNEKKEDINPPLPHQAGKAKRKSRLPVDFVLTKGRAEKAMTYWQAKGRVDMDVRDVFQSFVDHHQAHGKLMADWEAAWRTWYTNAIRFSKPGGGQNEKSSAVNYESPVDRAKREIIEGARSRRQQEEVQLSGRVYDSRGNLVDEDGEPIRPDLDTGTW